MSDTVILIPCKSLVNAKSRLRGVLGNRERQILAFNLMARTFLLAGRVCPGRIVVITGDKKISALAASLSADTYTEGSPGGLNHSMQSAFNDMNMNSDILYLPVDLPLVREADLKDVVDTGRRTGQVVIVGDRLQHGTNMLYIPRGMRFSFRFGHDSFLNHQMDNACKPMDTKVIRNENIEFDLDTEDDLDLYKAITKELF